MIKVQHVFFPYCLDCQGCITDQPQCSRKETQSILKHKSEDTLARYDKQQNSEHRDTKLDVKTLGSKP